jgi:hypothetical protein
MINHHDYLFLARRTPEIPKIQFTYDYLKIYGMNKS